jgi:hypothetical protein
MKEREKPEKEGDEAIDPILQANFERLRRGRAVGVLRAEMAEAGITIGTSTIQRALRGSDGLRVESLDKFAKFFGVARHQLLMESLGDEVSTGPAPAAAIDPDLLERFSRLSPKQQGAAEEALRQALERAEAASGKPAEPRSANTRR